MQFIKHWNGHKWRFVTLTGPAAQPSPSFGATATAALTSSDVWAFSLSGGAMHWNGQSWSVYDLTSRASVLAAASDGHLGLWAVTEDGSAVKPRFWHLRGRPLVRQLRDRLGRTRRLHLPAEPGTEVAVYVGSRLRPR